MTMTVNSEFGLFGASEIEEIERLHPDGVSSQEVITLFQSRGVKLSEATFRKYIQLGLLPTSKRVGRKGKHKGSQGVYPVSVIRRINLVKGMMAQDMTLEEICDSFIAVQNGKEEAEASMDTLFEKITDRIERLKSDDRATGTLPKELSEAKKIARSLMKKIEMISSQLAATGATAIPKDQGGGSE
jgi:DNA-binding transcriptional MerR regulator